jgi:hypothetical protein
LTHPARKGKGFFGGDESAYYLRAAVAVKETDDKHWSGTLQLPSAKLPPLKQDR